MIREYDPYSIDPDGTWMFVQPCAYCGAYNAWASIQREHVTPRAWGHGGYRDEDDRSIVPACRRCNQDKGVNTPATWFFSIIRKGDGVLGRNETIGDRRLSGIWAGWEAEIRLLLDVVLSMLPEHRDIAQQLADLELALTWEGR